MDLRCELSPGVIGYSEVDTTGVLHIADVVSIDPGEGNTARYLDSLPTDKEVRVHDVINHTLKAMPEKRRFVPRNADSHVHGKDCLIHCRYPTDRP